jgi:hypothetical protein
MGPSRAHIQRAIEKIQDKAPLPEIDYTQHQLEDGNTVSTQERVVKDVRTLVLFVLAYAYGVYQLHDLIVVHSTGPSTGDGDPHRRPILFSSRSIKA